jgi:hypothetical protein
MVILNSSPVLFGGRRQKHKSPANAGDSSTKIAMQAARKKNEQESIYGRANCPNLGRGRAHGSKLSSFWRSA